MRFFGWLSTAALVMAPLTASAQVQPIQPQPITDRVDSHWLASGFVGSNFAQDTEASVDFGGTVGYLWRGMAGAEFQANFSPDFQLLGARNALLLGDEPWINSYMLNAMGAIPLGDGGRWSPYVSGGLGTLTLRSDTLGTDDALSPNDSRTGGNFGFGVMGFGQSVGIRGDVRYFKGFEDGEPAESAAEAIGSQILSNLEFWRAHVGVAFRW